MSLFAFDLILLNRLQGNKDFMWYIQLVSQETLPTSERGSLHCSFIPEECSFAKRYDSCNISHVMSKLSHRETEFEMEVPTPPCRASPPKFTDNFQERVNNFMQMVYSVCTALS